MWLRSQVLKSDCILQMGKLKHRKNKLLAQGYIVMKWQSQNSSSVNTNSYNVKNYL